MLCYPASGTGRDIIGIDQVMSSSDDLVRLGGVGHTSAARWASRPEVPFPAQGSSSSLRPETANPKEALMSKQDNIAVQRHLAENVNAGNIDGAVPSFAPQQVGVDPVGE